MAGYNTALKQLSDQYEHFNHLLEDYPDHKYNKTGATGDWSPRQVVAHLTGWVQEANKRFNRMQDGDAENVYYDVDTFNEESVKRRSGMSWDQTLQELRQSMNTFMDVAVNLPKTLREDDTRYQEWLVGLAKEFRNHRVDLVRFLGEQPTHDYPILEYDPTAEAIIEPSKVLRPLEGMPERVILCFFQEVITSTCGDGKAEQIGKLVSEIGITPIYKLDYEGRQVAVAHPGVGAPLAGGMLEELIAIGGRKFIACGGAGVLEKDITVGHVVVPESAIRDEGTSYHYLPPSREVNADREAVTAIKRTLTEHKVPYVLGKTWTTDALYRETPSRTQQRREEGCLTVEMEAATFFAIAKFRNVQFGQILYGGDDLSGVEWDNRGWQSRVSAREQLFWLAVEAVLKL